MTTVPKTEQTNVTTPATIPLNVPATQVSSFDVGFLPIPIEQEKTLHTRFGVQTSPDTFHGIMYFTIPKAHEKKVLKLIPREYRHLFSVLWMEINYSYIPPHTDSDILTVINIYIITDDAVTTFYFPNATAKSVQIENQTNGCIYNVNDLFPCAQFKAQSGEAWVLDVTTPHSVKTSGETTRCAYCIQTSKMDYHDVVKILT
ncbi:hypothetical protein EB118_14540 [bacterium]|nr:hypothetical protein [bacterium]NDD83692.1 hypothetical protein [bacterium]NDG31274.1 hypothetical protein [bacterium]